MVDVSRMNTKRRKYCHHFQDITCVIYVVDLATLDCFEDHHKTLNSLQETVKQFHDAEMNPRSNWEDVWKVVLLNKFDLLTEKLKKQNRGHEREEIVGG